ncbi:hypothetical protein ACIO02_21605 [Streptomyces sp. NPDC087568]|uniref:hypothetical protein n=1 Tax=Streptomyces sp. NPDC087568 TaxID=3365799 RepID=UPI0038025A6B
MVKSDDLAVPPGGAGRRAFDDELISEVSSHDRRPSLTILLYPTCHARHADACGADPGPGFGPNGPVSLPALLLLKAAPLAARQVPELNGSWTDDRFTAGKGVHLGVAVSCAVQGSSPQPCTTPTPWTFRR